MLLIWNTGRLLLPVLLLLTTASIAYAAVPKGSVAVDSNNQFTVTTTANKTYSCALIKGKYVSGKKLSNTLFITFAQQAKNEKKKGNTSKYNSFTKKSKAGNTACAGGPPNPGGGDTSNRNFDFSGNVTAKGKALFGIPTGLEANVARGLTVRNYNCTGCHVDRVNWTFGNLRERIKLSPMYYDESIISDQSLADLVAYLNRFQLP